MKRGSGCCAVDIYCTAASTSFSDSISYITYLFSEWRIPAHFPDPESHNSGRETLPGFKEDIGPALQKTCEEDYDRKFLHNQKAAKLISEDIFSKTSKFEGTFLADCQELSMSRSLLTLVNMILRRPNINDSSYSQETLSLSQLIMFNIYKPNRDKSKNFHHSKTRETPLSVHLGALLHFQTRKEGLADKLFHLGLCISYDRVLEISSNLANTLCQIYEEEGSVCPPSLKNDVFTAAAVDNIDHNPSSTTSLFQHPTIENQGTDRPAVSYLERPVITKTVTPLPDFYVSIPPVVLRNAESEIPQQKQIPNSSRESLHDAIKAETEWLSTVKGNNENETQSEAFVSWSAYHAEYEADKDIIPAISVLLPLISESSKSVAVIRHCIDIIKKSVNALNPGQTQVVGFDHPLFAIAKQIQWTWPALYGENKIVIMFGGSHVEKTILTVLGKLLEGSGWTEALTQANVATSGIAESLLKCTHITRARRVHQITVCSLFILSKRAHSDYLSGCEENSGLGFEVWCSEMSKERPQFLFRFTVFKLQLHVLIFLRSIRGANFELYINSLSNLVPWRFALNHYNYARWLPVHLRDMLTLKDDHPLIAKEFSAGKFVVRKTERKFSGLTLDHVHEQNNAIVKVLCADGLWLGLKWPGYATILKTQLNA